MRRSQAVYKRTCKIHGTCPFALMRRLYIEAATRERERERESIDRVRISAYLAESTAASVVSCDLHEKLLFGDRCVQMPATAIWIRARRRQVFLTRYNTVTIYETFKPMAFHIRGFR